MAGSVIVVHAGGLAAFLSYPIPIRKKVENWDETVKVFSKTISISNITFWLVANVVQNTPATRALTDTRPWFVTGKQNTKHSAQVYA